MWRNRALVLDFFSDFGDFFERNISQNIFEMNILHNIYFLKLIFTNLNSKFLGQPKNLHFKVVKINKL